MCSMIRASAASFLALSVMTTAGVVVGLESAAAACSPPRHRQTLVVPGDGQSMPASAPGIIVSGEDGIEVQLLDAGGSPVAGRLEIDGYRKYFAPTAPLAVGAYELRYQSWAPADDEAAPDVIESSLDVTAAVPLPTTTGTLAVATTARATKSVVTSSGSCTESADASMVRLALDLDRKLLPFADAVAWETKVDGQHWSQALGRLSASENVRTVLNLFTTCDSDGTAHRDDGLEAGVHSVEVRPIVVGSGASIAPATITVTVSCGADNGTVHPAGVDPNDPPGGRGAGGDPTGTGAGTGAGSPETDSTSDARAASDVGCTAAPRGRGSLGFASLVGLVALAAAAVRRRQ